MFSKDVLTKAAFTVCGQKYSKNINTVFCLNSSLHYHAILRNSFSYADSQLKKPLQSMLKQYFVCFQLLVLFILSKYLYKMIY